MRRQIIAPFAPAVDEDFGVAVIGDELVPFGLKLASEFAVVVDAAVEDDRDQTFLLVPAAL